MGFGKYVTKLFEIIPYGLFLKMYPFLKKTKLSDFADYAFENVFEKKSRILNNTKKHLQKVAKKGRYCSIEKGTWDYQFVNFCLVKNMLSNIIWCVERGFIPIINLFPSESSNYTIKSNLWEMFFEQPLSGCNAEKNSNSIVCPIISSPIIPKFSDARKKERVELWNTVLELFAKYNKSTLEYFDSEIDELIKGKHILACVLRSTDYTKLKPQGHPIQPANQEVFEKIREVMKEYHIDGIYIATEDYNIAEAFKKEFPGMVIENKRRYFNEKYEQENLSVISQVHFERENDDYLKMLEYMSSMNIVNKCEYLVTGLSGGSEMAIYRNGNTYKYSYIFDKGVY